MSDAVKPQMHGRDHRRGGADPIPGLDTAPWVRLKVLDTGQTWGAQTNQVVLFDDATYSLDPDGSSYFGTANLSGTAAYVHPKVSGLYQMTFRSYPSPSPLSGYGIAFNATDWDLTNYYETFVPGSSTAVTTGIPINTSGAGYAELTFRSGTADYSGATTYWNMILYSFSSTFLIGDGTYWEIRYLSGADYPRGLDNIATGPYP